MFDLNTILRDNIKQLKPYSSARDDFSGEASVWIDANENPYNTDVNRYPDPHQRQVKKLLASIKNVKEENVFIGNGSDEIIDILYRIVCEPSKSNVIVLPPTYGMYSVAAEINDVEVKKVFLNEDFSVNLTEVLKAIDCQTKLIFICSPNNPTGNVVPLDVIATIASKFSGIVVVDEAYIDFTTHASAISLINSHPNIYVMQTLSKAWGMAGARLGVGIGSNQIQEVMAKVKAPYNVNILSQHAAIKNLSLVDKIKVQVAEIVSERKKIEKELLALPVVLKVYPSEANFLLVKFKNASDIFKYLIDNGIVARDRSKEKWCDECIRITVGTPEENKLLVNTLKKL